MAHHELKTAAGLCRKLLRLTRGGRSLEALNGRLLDKCVAYAKAHPHPDASDKTVWEMF